MRTEPLVVERIAGPVVLTIPMVGRTVIEVGGVPVEGRGFYQLPASNGGTIEARLRPSFMDPYPVLEVAGERYATGPRTHIALRVLALLPIALVPIGGLVGVLLAILAVLGSYTVLRTGWSAEAKAGAVVGIVVAAFGVFALVIALTLASATG